MKRVAQGTVEYLLMTALVLIIIVWGIYYVRILKGGQEKLADNLSNAEKRFNEKVLSEVSSNIGG
ncbi:hypothetical protein X802_08790 [Thermococcus guaymasensis DSM 11113]|uniref:Class III signal peptide-containing protein n=1 Tax=Thermococcus guaymasensis DSM 11113 TaxID=1432656 RepID=A0A0X1KLS2_9EURY|nr:hypothetical protein [Thermococcus guaymasensis]AJC72221.1 hypothetical protein X802_08790 [Thermococcus guaymasensis DSM 11113]